MFIAILSESYRAVGEEERENPTDTTYSKIVDEYNRRRQESDALREEAIQAYGKKRYLEQKRQRRKVCLSDQFLLFVRSIRVCRERLMDTDRVRARG